jgi:hypothetical protein
MFVSAKRTSYHYYTVVTDMSESVMSHEHILKFYRKRSQVENNIKDIKNGMDFYHFPCMSLKANNVWGIIGVIGYNLMRYASIAGEVINHDRSIEIRVMNFFLRRWRRPESE